MLRKLIALLSGFRPSPIRTSIPWIRIDPPIRSKVGHRSATLYRKIIEQFDVEHNPRYTPRDGKTYCNIFAWDVTSAMSAELPHWVTSLGEPADPEADGAQRLSCNAMHEWLQTRGKDYGWYQTDLTEAVHRASLGYPTVAIFSNPSGNGHIVVLRPDSAVSEPSCAQAGEESFSRGFLSNSFGDKIPTFWSHP